MSTEILLRDLRFRARHGVLSQERVVDADFAVSLRLLLDDASRAVLHDELEGTANYAEAYAIVRREMGIPSALIEHVAGRIAAAVLRELAIVEEVEVEVVKLNPPMSADCAGCAVRLKVRR